MASDELHSGHMTKYKRDPYRNNMHKVYKFIARLCQNFPFVYLITFNKYLKLK
jgi:hypothetical protein